MFDCSLHVILKVVNVLVTSLDVKSEIVYFPSCDFEVKPTTLNYFPINNCKQDKNLIGRRRGVISS